MAILAYAYDSSFSGVNFLALIPITSPPMAQEKTQYHIPSTNNNVEMDMGKGMKNWEQKIALDDGDKSNLESAVGNRNTFVVAGISISDVKLEGITSFIKAPGFPTWEVTLQLSRGV